MKTSFLNYYKLILEKVSFDRNLFLKEYKKALNTLQTYEATLLDRWLIEKGLYANVMKEKNPSYAPLLQNAESNRISPTTTGQY